MRKALLLSTVFLLASAAHAAYQDVILADQPAGYWRLGEAPPPTSAANLGSLGEAAAGAYLNGAQSGQPGAIVGDSDTAAVFDTTEGTGQKIDVPYNAGLNPATFTIECWAKVVGGTGHRSPLSSRDDTPPGTTGGYIFYCTPANGWEFWTGTGGVGGPWQVLVGPDAIDSEWAHLVATFDGTTRQFYVNGARHGVGSATFVQNQLRPLRIGGGATEGSGNFFFSGNVDEVAVYGTALSPERILAHYKAGSGTDPIPVAPSVAVEPQAQTVFIGQRLELSVGALGSLPLTYAWKKDGAPIGGATGPTHTVAAAALGDAGMYSVEVTNDGGSAASAEVQVEVLNITIPVISQQPRAASAYAGGTPQFSVVASGSPNLTYQWQFGTTDLPGETRATLLLRNVQPAQQGEYRVRVTSEAGSTTSDAASLTVIALPANSYASFIMADQPAAYWRLGETSGDVAQDWSGGFNGAYMNGVTLGQPGALAGDTDTAAGFISDVQTKVEVPYAAGVNPAQFSIECWAKVTGGQGGYRSPLTSRADGPQRGYIFYATPGDVWEFWTGPGWNVLGGPAVQYDVWTHLVGTYDGTTKRFYVNGAEVANNTSAFAINTDRPLRIGAGATDDPTGNFFFYGDVDEVAVYDHVLTPERVLAHFGAGLGSTTPPTITRQPSSVAVLEGGAATFSAQATGSLPLEYQWQFKGANLPGETQPTLTIASAQKANEGAYRVVARNTAGTATSDEATLSVVTLPDVAYKDQVTADEPVAYWRLGESSGDTAADALGTYPGQYLNGVVQGQPGAISGDPDTAGGFQAATQTKVEVPFAYELNTAAFSIECWARVTGAAGNYRSPVSSRADGPQRGYIFYAAANNNWEFWTGKGDQTGWDVVGGPAVQLNQWVHLVGTYDGTTKRFFVNGVEVGSNQQVFGPNDEHLLRIGGGATEDPVGNFFFEGTVDEVAFYNEALTPVQILVHYALGAKPSGPPTLTIERTGAAVTITWANGALEEASAVTGGWSSVSAASPLVLATTTGQRFYRVRQ